MDVDRVINADHVWAKVQSIRDVDMDLKHGFVLLSQMMDLSLKR
jgi:hypothetical protein